MFDLELAGKVAVITGSTRGIGRAIAFSLAKSGARVCVNGRDDENIRATVKELQQEGFDVIGVSGDVGKAETARRIIGAVVARWNTIDILVNNAGASYPGSIESLSEGQWDQNFNSNLKSAFFMVREVLPIMKKNRCGKIINMTSLAGIDGKAGAIGYSSAKSGLLGFTKSLALEVGPFGITVNALAPGLMKTDLTKTLYRGEREIIFESTRHATPLGRLGAPADIANVVLFFVSPLSSFITGSVLVIDGGFGLNNNYERK